MKYQDIYKGEHGMSFVLSLKTKRKCKVFSRGDILDLSVMVMAVNKSLAEKISKEKNMDMDQAIEFLCECIKDGYKSLD